MLESLLNNMDRKILKNIKVIKDFLIDNTPINKLPKTDAIFVFGHIDKRVAKHASKLFLKNKSSKVIISGGIGTAKKDPSGFPSEADYFYSIITSLGISPNSIIKETEATNTLENVLFGMKKSFEYGIQPKSLTLVCMPFLLKRSKATFSKQFPKIKLYGSSFKMEKINWNNTNFVDRLLAEIDRLDNYAVKGDIKKVRIPLAVRKAYSEIKNILKI